MIIVKYILLCCIIAIVKAEELHEFTDSLLEIQEFCEDQENVTVQFDLYSEENYPNNNHEWKCMLECVASELGIFRNHRFYDRGFVKLIKRTFPDENEALNKLITQISSECRTKNLNDRCEAGYEFMNCLQNILDQESPFINSIESEI